MSASLARGLNGALMGNMRRFPASVAAYGKPGGGMWAAGDRIVLTDLAKTLTAIATDGPDAFYTGWIADRIAEDMAANGGVITKADLAGYKAKERTPVRGTFLGYEIISMPPPSSGGIALVEMLNMLEELDIQKRARGSVEALHLVTEAMRFAFLDRARFLGDPDFTDVPVAQVDVQAAREDAREDGRPREGDVERRARQGHPQREPARRIRRHHALLGGGQGRHGRVQHLHARRRLRVLRRHQGHRHAAQQRDGRLQQEARHDER